MIIQQLKDFNPVRFVTGITYTNNANGCKNIVVNYFELSVDAPGCLAYQEMETAPYSGWDIYEKLFVEDYPVYIVANATIQEYNGGKLVFEDMFSNMQHDKVLKNKYSLDGVMTNEILLKNISQQEKTYWEKREYFNKSNESYEDENYER